MSTVKEPDVQWFVAREGKQHGPLNEAEMRAFVDFGHLQATDLLWRAGFPDWRPAPSVFPEHTFPTPHQPAPQRTGNTVGGPQQRAEPAPAPFAASAPAPGPTLDRMSAALAAGASRASAAQAGPGPQAQARPDQRSYGGPRSQPTGPAPERAKGGGSMRAVAIGLPLLLLAGGAGWYALNQQPAIQSATPVVKADPKRLAQPTKQTKSALETGSPNSAVFDTAAIDERLQKMPLWALLKQEFPDWYNERLRDTAKLTSENKSDVAIQKSHAEALVALRRRHAEQALSASSEKLRFVASAFLENLKSLKNHSTDACYSFISQGETSPIVIEMMTKPEFVRPIQAQSTAIFEAIADGRKTPNTHGKPVKGDYDTLAAELARLGWSQSDLQLFADPKSLARSPPDRVCSMVQDWFSAHLAVKDQAVQERLLVETLRPVVAG